MHKKLTPTQLDNLRELCGDRVEVIVLLDHIKAVDTEVARVERLVAQVAQQRKEIERLRSALHRWTSI